MRGILLLFRTRHAQRRRCSGQRTENRQGVAVAAADRKFATDATCKGAGPAPAVDPKAPYKLDAKGKCHDVKGKMASKAKCAADDFSERTTPPEGMRGAWLRGGVGWLMFGLRAGS